MAQARASRARINHHPRQAMWIKITGAGMSGAVRMHIRLVPWSLTRPPQGGHQRAVI